MKRLSIIMAWLLVSVAGMAQSDSVVQTPTAYNGFRFDDSFRGDRRIRIAFWNVENLFDTRDDSLKNDDDFTPEGIKHWNRYRFSEKIQNLAKVITAIGGWEALEIIGLSEVENRYVLNELIHQTPLAQFGYKIVHRESEDARGIDVAMLYRPEKFTVDSVIAIRIDLGEGSRPTRDILYITGHTNNEAVLHLFFNHWPSRWGGQMKTEPFRIAAAKTLRHAVDSILAVDSLANILIMGDFNDEPDNISIKNHLDAGADTTFSRQGYLLNITATASGNPGTAKHTGVWNTLDQVMIDRALFRGTSGLKAVPGPVIFADPFLLEEDIRDFGTKPNRSYIGMKYHGGYSDHLPVFVDLQLLKFKP